MFNEMRIVEHTHGCVLIDYLGNSLLSHPYEKCKRFLILDFRLDSGVWVEPYARL